MRTFVTDGLTNGLTNGLTDGRSRFPKDSTSPKNEIFGKTTSLFETYKPMANIRLVTHNLKYDWLSCTSQI